MTAAPFVLPDLGEGLVEAEILTWHVAPGDAVVVDQVLCDVETDKAMVALPSPEAGVIARLGAAVGDTLTVGSVVVEYRSDRLPDEAPVEVPAGAANAPVIPRPLASPAVRRRAQEAGVDLATVTGSAAGGRVTADDLAQAIAARRNRRVEAVRTVEATEQPTSDRAADRTEPLRGLRRRIAQAMTLSWQTIPHVTELRELDARPLLHAHQVLKAQLDGQGVRVTMTALFVKAVAAALRAHPNLNAELDMDREVITYHSRINVGVATSTADGLLVPVVHDADTLGVAEIARRVEEHARAARERRLTGEQLRAGTYTVTNYGGFDTWFGTPLIRPPEVGICGFGAVTDKVVAVNGQPMVRPILPIAVAGDHRLNDGDRLAAFVNTVAAHLTEPVLMLA